MAFEALEAGSDLLSHDATPSGLFIVMVASETETFLDEIYPDSDNALRRARQVKERLLATAEWTSVGPYTASRVTTA